METNRASSPFRSTMASPAVPTLRYSPSLPVFVPPIPNLNIALPKNVEATNPKYSHPGTVLRPQSIRKRLMVPSRSDTESLFRKPHNPATGDNENDPTNDEEYSLRDTFKRSSKSKSMSHISFSQGLRSTQSSSAKATFVKTHIPADRDSFKAEPKQSPLSLMLSKFIRLPKSDNPSAKPRKTFLNVMREVTDDHDLNLSDADMNLFRHLEGQESFNYGDCTAQLKSSGICVEVPLGTPMPKAPDTAWSFQYGPDERKVIPVPEKLTALGFSVASWIFNSTEQYKGLFMILVNAVGFRNCLIERLASEEDTRARKGKGKKIVIPLGWLYRMDIDSSFVLEHGEYADFGAVLGTIWVRKSPLSTQNSIFRKRQASASPGCSTNEQIRDEATVKNPLSKRRVVDKLHLIQKNENTTRLCYESASGPKFEIKNFEGGVGAAGCKAKAVFEEAKKFQDQNDRESQFSPFEIMSFSQFLGLPMEGSTRRSLESRLQWLHSKLAERCIYPNGTNQGFMNFFMGNLPQNGIRHNIFPKLDCRARKENLLNHSVMEGVSNPAEFIFICCSGVHKHYRVRCRQDSPDGLWLFSGPREDTERPSADQVKPLTRDLG